MERKISSGTSSSVVPKWLSWSLGLLIIIVLSLVALDKSYNLKQTLENKNPQNTISVSAEGKVRSVPDLATIEIGVLTDGATAAVAQDDSSKKINAIIDFVKNQGVKREDITTSQFNLYPQQDYRSGKTVITGYQASQNLSIRIYDVDKSTDQLGKVVAGVTGAGANQINGVNLTFNDPDKLRGEAREQAITKARQKAQELADAAGITLGRVVTVSESGSAGYPMPMAYATDAYGGMGGAEVKSIAPNMEPGQQDITANMTIVFEVK